MNVTIYTVCVISIYFLFLYKCVQSVRRIMISRTERINNSTASTTRYTTQKNEEKGSKNLFVGGNGIDTIINNADECVILAGLGDDQILSTGTKNRIESNGGNDNITINGNENTIKSFNGNNIINSTGDKNSINTNNGNNIVVSNGSNNQINVGNGALNQVRSTGNNVNVTSGDGELQLGFVGNDVNVDAGNGKHLIGFWGNNVDMNLGNGDNSIETLDFSLAKGNFNDFGADKVLEKQTVITNSTSPKDIVNTAFDAKEEIAKKYNLSDQEKTILNSIDLNAKFSDGNPLYVLVKSPRKSAAAGQDVYVIAKRDGTTHTWAVSDNECIATGTWKNDNVTGKDVTTEKTTKSTTYFLNGVSNLNINTKDGNNSINLTSDVKADSNININLGNATIGNDILIRNGFTVIDKEVITDKSENEKNATIFVNDGSTWNSPLIVDFNKDGQVSAKDGLGVDIDNNGIADGAATDGDKMLAMSDINGNNKIDGQEVFGDQTVSPFTGEKINAANGFEALKIIAEQAKQYTGIDCLKNGNVDLQSLKSALATVGVKLGFISDNNTTELEDLAHVASINVEKYKESNESGVVQHRQQGSYTDTEGNTQKVDDVWFKQSKANNPFGF